MIRSQKSQTDSTAQSKIKASITTRFKQCVNRPSLHREKQFRVFLCDCQAGTAVYSNAEVYENS